jgi:hypothetical protein
MYDEAVKLYDQAAKIAHDDIEKYKHLKKEVILKEATIYSNTAACYKQGQHNKKEVEYCTKVI